MQVGDELRSGGLIGSPRELPIPHPRRGVREHREVRHVIPVQMSEEHVGHIARRQPETGEAVMDQGNVRGLAGIDEDSPFAIVEEPEAAP